MAKKERKKFPRNFLWGAATSAYQVEGGNDNSDWENWRVKAERACDHYHRFEEDFDILEALGLNAYRLSIEWARIEPKEGRWDREAVAHYHQVLSSLRRRGVTVFVTLFHFTLPSWFAEGGGFERAENVAYFVRFARFCAEEFGGEVDLWATVNEPLNWAWGCYAYGLWPPQKKSWRAALRAYRNLAQAHKKAYAAIKEIRPSAQVGVVLNMVAIRRGDNSPLSLAAAWAIRTFYNRSFMALIRREVDFVGVNYYFPHDLTFVGLFTTDVAALAEEKISFVDRGDLSCLYPHGLYEILMGLRRYRKPIYITENGLADAEDVLRERFIREHLAWAWKAIEEGADLRGYFHWSLLDNFEWDLGCGPRFGLIEVDYGTMERRIRPSAWTYARIARENVLYE